MEHLKPTPNQNNEPSCSFRKSGKCPIPQCHWDAFFNSGPGPEMLGNTKCSNGQKIEKPVKQPAEPPIEVKPEVVIFSIPEYEM